MCDMKEQMRKFIETERDRTLNALAKQPRLVNGYYGIETRQLERGYYNRQLIELVQNAVDAIIEGINTNNSIYILLNKNVLYVLNSGAPLAIENGVGVLLSAYDSQKDSTQIGRFGIGFKSLIQFNCKIDFITRDRGVVRFDPQKCRNQLARTTERQNVPGLLLAWHLDEPDNEDDVELNNSYEWAQTIVKIYLEKHNVECVKSQINKFPDEFALFTNTALNVVFETSEYERSIKTEVIDNDLSLFIDDESQPWTIHKIYEKNLPIIWAIPKMKTDHEGVFWAFFDFDTKSYLPGILNAPWEINDGRTELLKGNKHNKTLMQAAAGLVVDTIPKLSTEDDPGKVLDYFPRQCGEDEIARPLVDGVWEGLKGTECIPDATGALRFGRELYRHPEGIGQELAEQWCAIPDNKLLKSAIHPTAMKGDRDSRLEALAAMIDGEHGDDPSLRPLEIGEWFAAVASVETNKAIEVLTLAVDYKKQCKTVSWSYERQELEIIPIQNGQLVSPDVAVFAPEEVEIPEGRFAVKEVLAENEEANELLRELGVRELNEEEWINLLNQRAPDICYRKYDYYNTDNSWNPFWALFRRAPQKIVQKYIEKNSWIRVKRKDGKWVIADNTLLPGRVIEKNDEVNSGLLIDIDYHKSDNDILSIIGLSDYPSGIIGPDKWDDIIYTFRHTVWVDSNRNRYRTYLTNRPTDEYLVPLSIAIPKGIDLLREVRNKSCSILSDYYIELLLKEDIDRTVKFGHNSNRGWYNYPIKHLPHPVRWLLLEHGTLQLGGWTVRLAAFREYHEHPALRLLPNWKQEWEPKIRLFLKGDGDDEDILPTVEVNNEDRGEFWRGLIGALATKENLTDDRLTPLWGGAAKAGVVPKTINGHKLSEVYITTSPDLAHLGRNNVELVITLDEHAFGLWREHGAQDLEKLVSATWEADGPEVLLIEAIPELESVLTEEATNNAYCRAVTNLSIELEGIQEQTECLLENDVLLIDYAQLAAMQKDEGLTRILKEIASTGWLKEGLEQATSILLDPYRRRREAAQGETPAEKLWLAVQQDEQILLDALGNPGFLDNNRNGVELAGLVLKHHGVATLYALRDKLNHLDPPARWNTGPAFSFVADLGFPEEYAKSANPKRDPEELVEGPIALPKLKEYQEKVKCGIEGLLSNGENRRRAVVSLPTGAGKTRVTVESAVEFVLKPKEGRRSVLWVAQSDELCEQAVSSFIRVWRNLGEEMKDLLIFRLWGGNPNPPRQSDDKPVVVVATVQTLNARMEQQELDWMRNPGLVVIDECHHAIAPTYTRVLNWLDAAAPMGRERGPEPPFIGLSATPFRVDDEESQRLARRYSQRCLPSDQKELYKQLSDPKQGVLSSIENDQPIERTIILLKNEEKALERYDNGIEGHEFEYHRLIERISERLTSDTKRNNELIDIVQNKLKNDGNVNSVLLFANSVKHAKEMAIRLNREGIAAAAISGKTPMVARRDFIERFQHGGLQVLTNYGVLTAGFDAPKVDMILISRLVYSPVSYMQMLGRGMRGPAMGGTARCLNVTLIDNNERFVHEHPYHYFISYYNQLMGDNS
ncbi:MAG: DEAD/DEAH box helicase [Candidatus Coatesbacteria bacterium]|nr:DEAD/DEAH box helicase [Candidatus Coatesbacteria bacterium]